MADWSNLLPDLLTKIAKEVTFYEDFITFAKVCTSWESAVATIKNFDAPSQFPCLMLPEDEEDSNFRGFFLLSNGGMIRNIMLPEACKRLCLSAHGGWLLTVGKDEIDAKLLHPLSRIQIDLPKLDTFPDHSDDCKGDMHFINKVVLSSSNPNTAEFVVMVIWGCRQRVGFCKAGDVSWTAVGEEWDAILDITCHKGLLYAISTLGEILVCNPHGSRPSKLQLVSIMPSSIIPNGLRALDFSMIYLLKEEKESEDDGFFIVLRNRFVDYDAEDDELPSYWTEGFLVFEFDLNDDGKWSKVESLGNKAVFVGYNASFSIASFAGCIKPNCIYFTDDYMDGYLCTSKGGGSDMGIYFLSDETVEPFFNQESLSLVTPPTWVF